ncbi:MAG: SDR family oxidoreductase [Dehalococcoidia bacterium]
METIAQLYDLSGKGAVVTGGAMGIGKAIALRLAEAGASVMIADADLDSARQTASEIQSSGGSARAFEADVRNPDDAQNTVQATVEAFGNLSILINNAGIYPICPVMDITEDLWERVLSINLKGSFIFSQAAAEQMIKGGAGGKIVNMASIDALHPNGSVAHYNASKGGLLMLTKALALELAPHGILVNAVAPGSIITPGTENLRDTISQAMGIKPEDILQNFLPRIPLGRMGEPDDVARVVLFLCSGAADYITGDVLVIDGGFLLS